MFSVDLLANGLQIKNRNMATNIKFILDTRYRRKDNTFPLIMRLLRDRKSISIPLGIYIEKEDWNAPKEQIRKNSRVASDSTRLNNLIQKKRIEAFDIIDRLTDSGRIATMDMKEIKGHIMERKAVPSFFRYVTGLADELQSSGRFGTSRNYRSVLSGIKKFRNGKDLELKQIDYSFLKRYENYYYAQGYSVNGLASFFKVLKAICNRAIRAKLMPRDWYPFEDYKLKHMPTRKRAVSKETIKRIEQLKLDKGTKIWLGQKLFLFSFYAAGINLTDIADLRHSDILNGRLEYTRNKTLKPYSIKLTEKAQGIIKEVAGDGNVPGYIFPILKEGAAPEKKYSDLQSFCVYLNRNLKKIGTMVGCTIPLTMYVARHTYATEAKRLGISVEVISELLNHDDIKTTQIYLAGLENNVLDRANRLITD